MTYSPFLLGGVINEHLKRWETKYPNLVKEIRDGLYVDDLMTGGESVETVTTKREKAIEVFEDGSFKLHKWHSNVTSLEENVQKPVDNEVLPLWTSSTLYGQARNEVAGSNVGQNEGHT